MSTLSISPFTSSPLHTFGLPKSSSGRSNCGGDVDWPSAFTSSNSFNFHDEQQQQQQHQHHQQHGHDQRQQHHHSNHNNNYTSQQHASTGDQQLNSLPRSTSFPHLATSPSPFSPLDAHASSPTLASPKLFSPLDALSPPKMFASSTRLLDLASPSHLSPSPLFAGGLSVSPRHGNHHSSLTASLSARHHSSDPFTSQSESSSSSSCPTDSYVPSTASAASTASSTPSGESHNQDSDVSMEPAVSSAASATARTVLSPRRPLPSSALSDMSNDHYLSFEVLNIDAMTGLIKTEETAFSPANAAVFDFVSLQQPLQDAMSSNGNGNGNGNGSNNHPSQSSLSGHQQAASSSSPQHDYPYPALNFDDTDAELLSRASSPASQLEAEDELDRITSPPDSSFFTSHAHHNHHNHNTAARVNHDDDSRSPSKLPSPFVLPPTSTRHSRSSSSRASKRSVAAHSYSQSTPSTPQYSSTSANQPALQHETDLTLLQSSVSHMDYQQRVKFVESFKALADKGESAVTAYACDSEAAGMDPAVLDLIFSPADGSLDGGAEYDDDDNDSDVDDSEAMDEDGADDMPLHRMQLGERMTGRRRKRFHVPSSPTRRFSVPSLRTSHVVSHVSGRPFPPLSPSLSVSSHNSSGSSPIPRSLASTSDEDSLHANSPHPLMAASVMPVSVMAQQITPVQAMRVSGGGSSNTNNSQVTTATAVVEEAMTALPVSPSSVVTAEAVTAATTATPAAAVAVAMPAVKAKPSKVNVSSAVVVDGVVPASVVPASPVHSSTAVTATLASASPSSIHRARVLPAGPPRAALAVTSHQSKKLKTGKAVAAQMYTPPVAACIPASPVTATLAYAQPVQAVEAKCWKAMK